MKKFILIPLVLFICISVKSQEFVWANTYDISNCNELRALAINDNGDLFGCGVYDAPPNVPYTGEAYIIKTDGNGLEIWTEYIEGTIIIQDMAAVGNGLIIMGQSPGPFYYKGATYGEDYHHMFLMMLDENGNVEWTYYDMEKYAGYEGNFDVSPDIIALHARGQSNLGDHVMIFDFNGNLLQQRLLPIYSIVDIALYNNHVYLKGTVPGFQNVSIDNIIIPSQQNGYATFVVALNENLIAIWASVEETLTTHDARVEANEAGIFVQEEIIKNGFEIKIVLKKLDFDGQELFNIEPPFYTNLVTLSPDMLVNNNIVALFVKNDMNVSSHKVILFDHALNLLDEKVISGPSVHFSGQIASNGTDLVVGHIHTGDINFDDDLELTAINSDKHLYLSSLDLDEPTGINQTNIGEKISIWPNPTKDNISIKIPNIGNVIYDVSIVNMQGSIMFQGQFFNELQKLDLYGIPDGLYVIVCTSANSSLFLQTFILSR